LGVLIYFLDLIILLMKYKIIEAKPAKPEAFE